MPRPKAAVPTVLLKAKISPELRAKVDLALVSEVEGRVPQGDISRFISNLLREFFASKQLNLALYGFPQGYTVRGQKDMIDALRVRLEGSGYGPVA